MKKKTAPPKYTPEVRERAIRLLEEVRAQHPSDWAAFVSKQPERLVLLIGTKAGTVGMPSYTAG